jgi:hypothetical protein
MIVLMLLIFGPWIATSAETGNEKRWILARQLASGMWLVWWLHPSASHHAPPAAASVLNYKKQKLLARNPEQKT